MAFKQRKLIKSTINTASNIMAVAEVTTRVAVTVAESMEQELVDLMEQRELTKPIRNLVKQSELKAELRETLLELGYSDEQIKSELSKLDSKE